MHLFSPDLMHDLMATYGLWVLFVVVLLECMGIPMPGETALVSAALYAGSTHRIGVATVVAVAAAAAIIGDNLGYLIGRRIGFRMLLRHGWRIRLNEPRLKVGEYLFLRHGGKVVFFGRFIAILRTYSALLAGVNRMPWPHFLLMNALGGVVWATVFGVGAYVFGKQVAELGGGVIGTLLLIGGIIAVICGFIFVRHHEEELIKQAEAAIPGPLSDYH